MPWQITLHVPKDDGAFSNTPQVFESTDDDGMKTVKFAETKPLPSYLVALAVGPMDIVPAGHAGANNTEIRIIVPRGRGREAQYVAGATPDIVNLLEKYFGIPYPYEKLDEVAIPLAGYAMEHPGLVTYGSGFFLSKPEEITLDWKRTPTSVIAHELAHQWVGDLVTTAWWNDIWLNEGFATWMANKIVNQYHPEWKMNLSELNGYQGAMGTDELVSSRKVRQPILSDDDIANAFDNITYNKGSALLNMFESYIGPEKFQEGIRRYLRKYAWGNATSEQFMEALSGNDQAVGRAFSTFLDQAGVPLMTVQLQCERRKRETATLPAALPASRLSGLSQPEMGHPGLHQVSHGVGRAAILPLMTGATKTVRFAQGHWMPELDPCECGCGGLLPRPLSRWNAQLSS